MAHRAIPALVLNGEKPIELSFANRFPVVMSLCLKGVNRNFDESIAVGLFLWEVSRPNVYLDGRNDEPGHCQLFIAFRTDRDKLFLCNVIANMYAVFLLFAH